MGVWYRLGQFWRIVYARPLSAAAQTAVSSLLSESEQALFAGLSWSDQWHSYQVMLTLQAAGHTHPDLLAAALLHDVGKARVPISLWDRTLIVLANRLWPQQTAVWGAGEAAGWQRPFVVKAQHPAWGAKMAAAAGSCPLTVCLINRHQDELGEIRTEADRLLHWLQWADDQC